MQAKTKVVDSSITPLTERSAFHHEDFLNACRVRGSSRLGGSRHYSLLLCRSRLWCRLDSQRECFGVGHLDLVALLDDLELLGVVHGKCQFVAPGPLERDRALLWIDRGHVG